MESDDKKLPAGQVGMFEVAEAHAVEPTLELFPKSQAEQLLDPAVAE